MFQKSEVLIVNKMDLLKHTNFSMEELYRDIESLNADMKIFEVSCTTGEGLEELQKFFREKITEKGGVQNA